MKKQLKLNPMTGLAGAMTGLVFLVLGSLSARSQSLPPAILSDFTSKVGSRIEALNVLGGDIGLQGGTYKGNGSDFDTHLNVSKFGGGGDLGDPMPLGETGIGWQPRIQGSMGYVDAKKDFVGNSPLAGDENEYKTFAIQFGGGARFWVNDNLSFAPTFMGMYGHTKNDYDVNSALGQTYIAQAVQQGVVNWDVDTWTVRPAIQAAYVYTWHRTIFTAASDFTYYHTESFHSSSSLIDINGDSESWRNMIDVDVPTGVQVFGHELRSGGYFSRTELYDNLQTGLNADHIYDFHPRIVLDFLNELWKVQWIGLGGSYLWGNTFHGYSIGIDINFRF